MFTSIIEMAGENKIPAMLLCTAVSMICGLIIALIYMHKSTYTKSFVVSLVILPALVQSVIMVVNGNLGASVAVLGAFSLVRFRSAPGSSKEITAIFFSVAVGLANGMGYLAYSGCLVALVGIVFFLLNMLPFGEGNGKNAWKELKILIPENLDYTEVFDEIFETYLKKQELIRVKTTDLGSMYELSYHIILKDAKKEKEFLDAIRCRNGNLTIICGRMQNNGNEQL